MERVGDRWTLLVIDALMGGPRRFNELGEDVLKRHADGYGKPRARLSSTGFIKHRHGGEFHANNPAVVNRGRVPGNATPLFS